MKLFVRHSLRDFTRIWKNILLFEAIYRTATSLLFAPALVFVLNRFLLAAEAGQLLNGDVYRVALSVNGFLLLAAAAFVGGLLLFLEFGTVIVIAQQRLFGRAAPVTGAFAATVRAVPRLLGLGCMLWLLVLFIFSPWIDTPLSAIVFENINVPITFVYYFYESKLWFILYVGLLAVSVYVLLRSAFAFHFILIEGQRTTLAIRNSFRLTRKRQGNLIVHLALLNGAAIFAGALIISLVSALVNMWEPPFVRFVLRDWYVSAASLLAAVFTMLAVPFNLVLLTRLFYVMRRADGEPIVDRLTVTHSRFLGKLEAKLEAYFRPRSYRRGFALLAVVYAAAALSIHQSNSERLVYLDWHTKVIAHRGNMYAAPENTLPSIRHAIEEGVDAVEIDVQLTKDGVVVLHHDFTLERLAGVPLSVHDLTFSELAGLDLYGIAGGMPTARIATLSQVLQEVKGKTKLVIEIKPYGDKRELARSTVELIAAENMAEDVYVQSFDSEVLRIVRELMPELKIAQILFAAAGNVSALDVDIYTINQTMLSDRFLKRAHEANREVWVWTVNIERNMREVLKYDVDGIITDYPAKLRSIVGIRE